MKNCKMCTKGRSQGRVATLRVEGLRAQGSGLRSQGRVVTLRLRA